MANATRTAPYKLWREATTSDVIERAPCLGTLYMAPTLASPTATCVQRQLSPNRWRASLAGFNTIQNALIRTQMYRMNNATNSSCCPVQKPSTASGCGETACPPEWVDE